MNGGVLVRSGWVRVWRVVAYAGIATSLYAGWLTVDDIRDRASSERDIETACDHLVSGAQVMDLRGGMGRAKSTDWDRWRLDVQHLPGRCTIYRVPEPGKTKTLFTLDVRTDAASEPLNRVGDDGSDPFNILGTDPTDSSGKHDVTSVAAADPEPRPIGDGTLGRYGPWYATVRSECAPAGRAKSPRLMHFTARAEYADVSAADRGLLARIARGAALKYAERAGCRTQLPALPDQLGTVSATLRPARTATGSCRWFAAHLKERGPGRLPDRALAVPAPAASPVDSCLLAVGPDQVGRIAGDLGRDQRDRARGALASSPWWVRTASFVGTEAGSVGYDTFASGDDVIEPGTAGGHGGVWWASSVCAGRPALHTLTVSDSYDNVLTGKETAALFRAYVDDITARRGCTRVTYPDPDAFLHPAL